MNSGNTLKLLTNGHIYAISVVLSIPNDRLLSGSTDSNIVLWDINTGNIIRYLIGHRNIVFAFFRLFFKIQYFWPKIVKINRN